MPIFCPSCLNPASKDAKFCAYCNAPLNVEPTSAQAKALERASQSRRYVSHGLIGFLVGAFIGYLLRPAAPFVGQLPFGTVITRGSNLEGLDQLLVSTAESSFNYMLIGAIIGCVGLILITSALSRNRIEGSGTVQASRIESRSAFPKSVELGYTPEQVEAALGQPEKIINLGSKMIHVYSDMKITYLDGKVSDVQ